MVSLPGTPETTSVATVRLNLTTANAVKEFVSLQNDAFLFCFQDFELSEFGLPYKIFNSFVNPTLSLIGQALNVICLLILRRSGLEKPSNILLFALVLADSMNLFTNLNYGNILRLHGPDKHKPGYCTWEYTASLNMFLHVSKEIFFFVGNWGHTINAIIPMIITTERFLAVFFPITFKKLVTRRAVVVSCFFAFIAWFPMWIFLIFTRRLLYIQVSKDKYVSGVFSTELLAKNFNIIYILLAYVAETLASLLPTFYITAGCIIIGIKIKLTLINRRKLINNKVKLEWSPRTTRTLVVSCLIFSISHIITTLISQFSAVGAKSPSLTYFLVQISEFINAIQCSSNFFVYMATNTKLWIIFLELVQCGKK